MHTVAVDTQIMRGINAAAVLDVLRAESPLNVSAIAARTGLSRQAVTRALTGLESSELVEVRAPDPKATNAGRPAQSVVFRGEAAAVVGIAIAPEAIRMAVSDLTGKTIGRRDLAVSDVTNVPEQLSAGLIELLDATSTRGRVWAAAVGVPGIVDAVTGTIRLSSSMASLEGDALRDVLAEILECRVHVDNDVKLATEGEQWRGTRNELISLVLIEWGERVGAGLILNGSLYRGASNDSGDLGFLQLAASRPQEPTDPSLFGPFERSVGSAEWTRLAIEAAHRYGDDDLISTLHRTPAGARIDVLIGAMRGDSAAALESMQIVAARFARGVAAIRALVDPELVIIGGRMAACGDVLLEAIRAELADEILDQPRVELSILGGDAVVQGTIHNALAIVEASRFAPEALTGRRFG